MARILVVEDSLTIQYIVQEALAQQGHAVISALDGEAALQLAIAEQPHIVLLDVILPKRNGYQVCRQLKATPETAMIPVVMITSKAQSKDRRWGLEQGADDYIAKPFDADDLLEVVERFLPQTS